MKKALWLVALAAMALVDCGGGDGGVDGNEIPTSSRAVMLGITEGNELIQFFADTPGEIVSRVQIDPTDIIADPDTFPFPIEIDIRPATSELYLHMSDGRLYTIAPSSGDTTLVGRVPQSVIDADVRAAAFDPLTDEIRMLGAEGQSFRVSPTDASLLGADTTLAFVPGDANEGAQVFPTGLDYSGTPQSRTRTAYIVEDFADTLSRVGTANDAGSSANGGEVRTIANLAFEAPNGLTVQTVSPIGYTIRPSEASEQTNLGRLDLETGQLTDLGRIGNETGRFVILAITVLPGTGEGDGGADGGGTTGGSRAVMLGVTEGDELIQFFADTPGEIVSRVQIDPNDIVADPDDFPFAVAIDIRPATSELYLYMVDGRLYTVAPSSGDATLVGRVPQNVIDADIRAAAFDPLTDEIRMLGAEGENFRVSPTDASLLGADTMLAFVPGDANEGAQVFPSGLDYSGTPTSGGRTAYLVEDFADTLSRLGEANDAGNSANGGEVRTIADLAFGAPNGLTVQTDSPIGYTIRPSEVAEQTNLGRLDLESGQLTDLGRIGNETGRFVILAITVLPGTGGGDDGTTPPEPQSGTLPGESACRSVAGGDGTSAAVVEPNDQCLACSVADETNLVDADLGNFATVDLTLGLLFGTTGVTVRAPAGVLYPGGNDIGFKLRFAPAAGGEVQVLPDITIRTYLETGGQATLVEAVTFPGDAIRGDLAGAIASGEPFLLGFAALPDQPFNRMDITPSVGVIGLATVLEVNYACVDAIAVSSIPSAM